MAPSRTTTIKVKSAKNHTTNSSILNGDKKKTKSSSKIRESKKLKPTLKQPKSSKKFSITNRKTRVYTEKELNIPKLNMIKPSGIEKPKGKKKGKIFVDDKESMMTILAIINAEKNGQIESQIMKARQMEEIREARKAESEKKRDLKRSKMNEIKESLRKRRKRTAVGENSGSNGEATVKSKLKSVSFVRELP